MDSTTRRALAALTTARPRLALTLASLAAAGLCFAVPLYFLDTSPVRDWDYFDALVRLTRSSLLAYGRAPLHDPWMCGGLDVLSNPESRVFSPSFLLDLAFTAHTANVLSLAAFGAAGFASGVLLLRHLGRSPLVSAAGALAFLTGSWFALHFSEGHVPFGPFQLLPLVALALLRLEARAWQLVFVALLALFLLEGAMYPFFLSIELALGMALLGLVPLRAALRSVRGDPLFVALVVLGAAAVTLPKVLPVLGAVGSMPLGTETTVLDWRVLRALFHPTQHRLQALGPYGHFHEYGCYLGFASLGVIGLGSRRGLIRTEWRWAALVGLFLWIGTGWLSPVNPWTLVQHTPFLRNAHVQSRLFIILYLGWIVLVTGGLERLRPRPRLVACLVVVLELLAVHTLAWRKVYAGHGARTRPAAATAPLITTTEWRSTLPEAEKPGHYDLGGHGSAAGYEPWIPEVFVRPAGAPDYRGEIYLSEGTGTPSLVELSPGKLVLTYEGAVPATVVVNSHSLQGWEVVGGEAELLPDPLITLRVHSPGEIELSYRPWYWPWAALGFALGLLLLAGAWSRLKKTRLTAPA